MRDAARFFQLLADEARLRMRWLPVNHGEPCVCDAVETPGITPSKSSRHLLSPRRARPQEV